MAPRARHGVRRWDLLASVGSAADEQGVPKMQHITEYDLTAPETFQLNDIHQLWRRVRRDAPVYWHPYKDTGFWVLSRYEDVVRVYKDNQHFTSERGSVLDVLLAGGDPAGGRMLAVTDGRRHRAIRKVMSRFFTPRALSAVADSIRERTRQIVAEAAARNTVDFATEVADRLPIEAICDLMAIPERDRPHLLRWNKAALSSDDPDTTALDAHAARAEILFYFTELIADRRATPGDDVVSALAAVEVDGEPLDDEDLALNCYSLILGGDESTRMSACCAAVLFAHHPEQWRRLRAGAPVETAVEEVLRWATPSMHFARTASVDVRVGAATVRKGDVVTLWNTSANFDEAHFTDPEVFDITRSPNDHVTFGQGHHYCLGAVMAKLELRFLLEALRDQVREIELLSEPRQVYSNFLFGYSSVPSRLVPAT
ncbi:cytochrome P450 [Micromonospora sp. DT31]|uniref:cytochrome P450 n=1 Tax=Micromonospora sp. DT31 TaxID=3393434 RepID=UPI003CF72868